MLVLGFVTSNPWKHRKRRKFAHFDFLLAPGSVPWYLFLRKVEPSGCPNPLGVGLSDCFANRTQCTRIAGNIHTNGKQSRSLSKTWIFNLFVFHTHCRNLSTCSAYQLLNYADDASFCQAVLGSEEPLDPSSKICRIQDVSFRFGLYP